MYIVINNNNYYNYLMLVNPNICILCVMLLSCINAKYTDNEDHMNNNICVLQEGYQ